MHHSQEIRKKCLMLAEKLRKEDPNLKIELDLREKSKLKDKL